MTNPKIPKIQSLADFIKTYDTVVNESHMRYLIFNRKKNGADIFICRVGRRIYIDVEKFFEWIKREE